MSWEKFDAERKKGAHPAEHAKATDKATADGHGNMPKRSGAGSTHYKDTKTGEVRPYPKESNKRPPGMPARSGADSTHYVDTRTGKVKKYPKGM